MSLQVLQRLRFNKHICTRSGQCRTVPYAADMSHLLGPDLLPPQCQNATCTGPRVVTRSSFEYPFSPQVARCGVCVDCFWPSWSTRRHRRARAHSRYSCDPSIRSPGAPGPRPQALSTRAGRGGRCRNIAVRRSIADGRISATMTSNTSSWLGFGLSPTAFLTFHGVFTRLAHASTFLQGCCADAGMNHADIIVGSFPATGNGTSCAVEGAALHCVL